MRSVIRRNPVAAYVVAAAAIFTGGVANPAAADEPTAKDLVGSWEREGKINVYSADGAGTNHDTSRFRWEFNDGRLIAQRQEPEGKLGEEWSVPIVFTKDRLEFSFLLGGEDGGRKRVTFHKLDPNGRRFAGRTDADRAYPPDAEALKGEGPPDPTAPTPARPTPAEAPRR